jgi:hypothetical protein
MAGADSWSERWDPARTVAAGGCDMGRFPELRFIPCVHAGVGLAVWMGGACSEVDRHRWSADPLTQEPR